MSFAEWIYTFALGAFLIGVPLTFRDPTWKLPVIVMSIATGTDFLVTVLPQVGAEALAMRATGSNMALVLGAVTGLATWLLFVAALGARWRGRQSTYLGLVLATQMVWFTCYLLFLYGLHVVPMR